MKPVKSVPLPGISDQPVRPGRPEPAIALTAVSGVAPKESSDAANLEAPSVVLLWPDVPAESKGLVLAEHIEDRGRSDAPDRRYRNVTTPHLEVFRAAKPNGCGVVILPGGGYSSVVLDKEGREVARWLNSIGISAIALKYRLPNTSAHRFGTEVPLRDAQHAMRLVRSRAAEFGVQPDRLGVIGFSAGGHLASTLATHFDAGRPDAIAPEDRASCRPDFLILAYPVISMDDAVTHADARAELLGNNPGADLIQRFSMDLHVSPKIPPIFLVAATDDQTVKVDHSLRFYAAARGAGVPAELHLFERGGHGFGIRSDNRAGAAWPALCVSWLRERGFFGASLGE